MSYRKGFSYSRTKRFCENKMKAGQKGIITKQQGKTVNSTHVFNDDFWVCLTKNEVKKPIVELIVLSLFKIYSFQNSNCFKALVTAWSYRVRSKCTFEKIKVVTFELPKTVNMHSTIFFEFVFQIVSLKRR